MARKIDGAGDRATEREIEDLERRAAAAPPGFDGPLYNRAGDLCIKLQDTGRALASYGRAIDAFLKAERYDSAAAVCRKLLRISPGAVRARCTLAWLSLGKEHLGDFEAELTAYAEAARQADRTSLAAKQLRMMAETAQPVEIQSLLANRLMELGDREGAHQILGRIQAEASGVRQRAAADPAERWARVLRAALMGPDELA